MSQRVLSPRELVDTPLEQLHRLDGATAIVTGAAKGLGRAIAIRLHEAGANVVLADIDDPVGIASTETLAAEDRGRARYLHCDVGSEADLLSLVGQTVEAHEYVDILVNNAGIYPYRPALEMTIEEWDQVLAVDLRGPFLLCREVGRHMVANDIQGSIINVSSINAFRSPIAGEAHYDAAKAGLNALTRSLAVELGPAGIRVNAIAPGVNLTEGQREAFGMAPHDGVEQYPDYVKRLVSRTPLRRHGMPDDQARVVAFLASQAAAFISGQCLVVDGGALLV